MIELKSVSKFYNSSGTINLGLRNINLRFDKNEIVAIVGDSGSGKSTLLNVICKNDDFDEGEIYYKGNETSYFSVKDMDDFRKNKIGFIFQNYNIIDSYTVLENVMLPLTLKGVEKSDAKSKALELIEKVGLKGKENNRGTKLSGGEKQRCVIARALASDCEILACDEPTGNLDSKTSKEIISLIKEIASDKLVLIVTHNFEDFKDIVTRKIRIADGEVVEDVTFEKQEEDENVDLDLDYVKLPMKTSLKVAKNNVVFTPKKSIFLTCIFTVVFVLTLILLQSLVVDITSTSRNSYTTSQSDRFYIYDGGLIDVDRYKSESKIDKVVINPFAEDKMFLLSYMEKEGKYEYEMSSPFALTSYVHDVNYYKGDSSKDGIKIILPYKDSYYDSFLDKDVTMHTYTQKDMKVVAIGYSNHVKRALIMVNDSLFKELNYRYASFSVDVDGNAISNLMYAYESNQYINAFPTLITKGIDELEKPIILVPSGYQNKELKVKLFGLYEMDKNDYEVIYTDEVSQVKIFAGLNCKYKTYEASVYTKNEAKVKSISNDLGYNYEKTSDISVDNVSIEGLFEEIISYVQIIGVASLLLIASFITFFILQKVYQSKKNDYQILRTLGVTKKDMSTIVLLEVGIIGLASMVVSFIIGVLMLKLIPEFHTYSDLTFRTIFFYIILTLAFIILTGRSFNRKLFKFTVSRSLKE